MRYLPETQDQQASILTVEVPMFQLEREEVPDNWSPVHLRDLPAEVKTFYRLLTPAKLESLVQAVRGVLCRGPECEQMVYSATDDNAMLLAVLRHMFTLLRFGFVPTIEGLVELLGPLLRCLDGRTDWLQPPLAASAAATPQAAGAAAAEDVGGLIPEAVPLLQGASGRAEPAAQRPKYPPVSEAESRYALGPDWVMQVKVMMAENISHIIQVGTDLEIDVLIRSYAEIIRSRGSGENIEISDMAKAVLDALDKKHISLEQARVRSPRAMLADLMMYDDPKVFDIALRLGVCGGWGVDEKGAVF